MSDLFTGIHSKYMVANTLKTALYISTTRTGMYFFEAPQAAAYPYCVYYQIGARPEYTFTEEASEQQLQFNIFSEKKSSTEVRSLFPKLTALFDYAALTVAGWTHIVMVRSGEWMIRDPETNVWQYSVQYEVIIQK